MNEIAEKIRALRKERNLTLKEMSEKTDFSVSFLSQVENGASSLAITSLKKIADALEVPISSFFDVPETHNFLINADNEKPFHIEGSPSEFIRFSGDFPGRKLEAIMTTIPPKQRHGSAFNHPGEEFVYVLEGVLVVKIDKKEYLVKAGDAIHYPSNLTHLWSNPIDQPAKVLSVLTPLIF